MRAVGVRAVGIIHGVIGGTTTTVQFRPTCAPKGMRAVGIHVVIGGTTTTVQSGPTRAPNGISHASGLRRGRVSERLINTERKTRCASNRAREHEGARERERDTLTCNNKRDISML